MTREDIVKIVGNSRIFSARFVKKDGSERVMAARLGVAKYVTGAGLKFDPDEKGLLPVFDMNKKGYRMINLNTIKEIHANGHTYTLDSTS